MDAVLANTNDVSQSEYIKHGLLAAPNEEKKKFLDRVSKIEKRTPLPCPTYGMTPDWISVVYSNKKLAPWEVAATWITAPPKIQLRQELAKRGRYLSLSKEEILAHECVHAMRYLFDEPRFEELLAFRTARARWRRYFGPLFRTKVHHLLLIASVLRPPWSLIGLFIPLVQLIYDQTLLARAAKKLQTVYVHPKRVLLFLTDKEILFFAKKSMAAIRAYIAAETSVRWEQIRLTGERVENSVEV